MFTVRIVLSRKVNARTRTITLRPDNKDVIFKLPASTDIQNFGKYFLIRNFLEPGAKRHYTLSSCLKKPIYDEYIKAICQFKSGQKPEFNNDVLQENSTDEPEIIFTCKDYLHKNCLSHKLHT